MKTVKNLVFVAMLNFFGLLFVMNGSSALGQLLPKPSASAPSIESSANSTPTPSIIKSVTRKVIRRVVRPGVPPTLDTPAPPADPLAGRCIITIDGARYDVTDFRYIHSGGNVFTCGADESAAFHNRHPDSFLQRMDRYRV